MRILHLLNDVDNVGNGIVNVAVDLAWIETKLGHEVAVASGGGSYEDFLAAQGVAHIALIQRRRPRPLLQAVAGLARIIDAFAPDIVHAHMITGAVLARLVQHRGRFALVTTVHNEFQRSIPLMGLADSVIAVSAASAAAIARRGIASRKISIVRNGPLGSPRHQDALARPAAMLARPAIVTVSGLYRRKGIADLLAAFAQLCETVPAAHLYIVGDGPDRPIFLRQAAALPCAAAISFLGYRPFPTDFLRAADLCVLPSHSESFGLALAEARGAGAAVIGTAVGGVPEVLEFGRAGLLVPPRDPAALAARLRLLLMSPTDLRRWQVRAGANLAWLSIERVGRETIAVYRKTLDERPRHAAYHRHAAPVP